MDHITFVHDFWSYCNYLIYLSQKDKEDMNGLEGSIRSQIDDNINSWIPSNLNEIEEKASKKKSEEAGEQNNKSIEAIKTTTDELKKQVTEMQEKLKNLQEELTKTNTTAAETTKTDLAAVTAKLDSIMEAVVKK